jgi:hypothetical protein
MGRTWQPDSGSGIVNACLYASRANERLANQVRDIAAELGTRVSLYLKC